LKIEIPEISVEFASMTEDDLSAVIEIEQKSFSSPWSRRTFHEGLSAKYPHAHFLVCKHQDNSIAYINFVLVGEDCHITNLAVALDFRRLGVAKYMLAKSLDQIKYLGGRKVFLEVRMSNIVAQRLYRQFGFRINSIRKKYYSDNDEDAYVLWLEDIRKIRLEYVNEKLQG
tara:strand:+ start:192 stop:704 length:513 start_codon:yes stop_codon:yes gene_type:complete